MYIYIYKLLCYSMNAALNKYKQWFFKDMNVTIFSIINLNSDR